MQEEIKEKKNTEDATSDKGHSGGRKHQRDLRKLEGELASWQKKAQEFEEKSLYLQAEMINFRKRKEEETASYLKYANQDLILALLPILDNFERAIKKDDNDLTDELSQFLSGFKMMYAHMKDILKSFGVEEIEAEGKEFDPNQEEALMVDRDPAFPDNVVLEVLLKGYRLKDRIIRPASVKVNKLETNNDKGEETDE